MKPVPKKLDEKGPQYKKDLVAKINEFIDYLTDEPEDYGYPLTPGERIAFEKKKKRKKKTA